MFFYSAPGLILLCFLLLLPYSLWPTCKLPSPFLEHLAQTVSLESAL